MSTTELLAYLAGAIDSDGTIGIKRSTYSMRVTGDSEQATFSERVALRQVTPHIPALLREQFGGYLGMNDPNAKRGRPLHSWQATDKRAVACLTALLPFLRIKREQAENCLRLRVLKERSKILRVAPGRGHAGSARRPTDITEAMETLYLAAKCLNRVGA
jgi:hypothetical protein